MMAPEHRVLIFVLACVVSLLLGIGLAREYQAMTPVTDQETGTLPLLYFEGQDSLYKLRFASRVRREQWTLSTDNVTQGVFSLRISFPYEGGWMGTSATFSPDWSGYESFAADVTNPGVERVEFAFIIRDDKAPRELPAAIDTGVDAGAAREALRELARQPHSFVYYRPDGLPSGQSNVTFAIATMSAAGVDAHNVRDIYFYVLPSELPQVIFIDNVRLEGGTGAARAVGGSNL